MPELPEVEIMRRGILRAKGCTIRDVRRPPLEVQPIKVSPGLRSFRRRVIGRRITAVGRVGKRIVLELETGDRIVLEPRMSGSVMLAGPADREHLHLVIELSGRVKQLLFWDQRGLGVVRLVSPDQFEAFYGSRKIGPDALVISADELQRRLEHSRRAVKVALLDQTAVAGIGNIYASEALHRAGIHPAQPCTDMTRRQWQKLHAEIGKLLREAIRRGGSTLRENVFRTPDGGRGRYLFQVYQRASQRCLRCGGAEIVRIVQAQRSTFFCPACQRGGSARRDNQGENHA